MRPPSWPTLVHPLPLDSNSCASEMRFDASWREDIDGARDWLAGLPRERGRVAELVESDLAVIDDLSHTLNRDAAKLCVQDEATLRIRANLRADLEGVNSEIKSELNLKFAEDAIIIGPDGERLCPDGSPMDMEL